MKVEGTECSKCLQNENETEQQGNTADTDRPTFESTILPDSVEVGYIKLQLRLYNRSMTTQT